jgi:hypothetical protein
LKNGSPPITSPPGVLNHAGKDRIEVAVGAGVQDIGYPEGTSRRLQLCDDGLARVVSVRLTSRTVVVAAGTGARSSSSRFARLTSGW